MSSARFPGKVLAPFRGEPILMHVVRAAVSAVGSDSVVVLTSTKQSDDPVVAYLDLINTAVFRGSLNNVFDRFQQALSAWPCDRFVRVCADSPLLSAQLLKASIARSQNLPVDLVSNVFPRTFPKGQSLEIVDSKTFLSINASDLRDLDREHVTPIFYHHPDRYRIVNLCSTDERLAEQSMTVDTLDDLRRLESDREMDTLDLSIDRADFVSSRCL